MIAIDREIRIIMAVDMVNGIGEIFFLERLFVSLACCVRIGRLAFTLLMMRCSGRQSLRLNTLIPI